LQSPVVGEKLFYMVANQKIVAAINEQIGNEFSAMLQYHAIAPHFGAEALPELSAHFYEQAEEEKAHALRFIKFVIDTGARVNIPAVPAPQAHFKVAEDAVKLSLEQEEQVTTQIDALLSMAKAESDYTADNFLQWFIKEQLEEVASMGQLLRVVQRAGEGNLLRVEEFLRERKTAVLLSVRKNDQFKEGMHQTRRSRHRHETDPRKNLQARRSNRHKETGKNQGHGRHAGHPDAASTWVSGT
jgi:bacterioferritin B